MNIHKKNTLIIFFSYLSISTLAFLIYPLIEKIDYMDQIKEGFLSFMYILPIMGLIMILITSSYNFGIFLFLLLIILGNILPIILIYKQKKLYPFIIISIISFLIYIFIGIIIFDIKNGKL
jgi:hypothetical protein